MAKKQKKVKSDSSEFTPEEQQVIDGVSNFVSKNLFPKEKKKTKAVIPTVEELADQIRRAMENQSTYSPDLEFAITNAATNYRLLLVA